MAERSACRQTETGGILAEGVASQTPVPSLQSVVLGYGLNVSAAAYPVELSDRVTSLESELGRRVDRADLCAQSLATLAARYDDLLNTRFDAILDAWRARSPGSRGVRVSWEASNGTQSGVTAGIDDARCSSASAIE
jgi:biotin-(acetyl-CoA carboxylase) ligase